MIKLYNICGKGSDFAMRFQLDFNGDFMGILLTRMGFTADVVL
jgi:hypothetical protein